MRKSPRSTSSPALVISLFVLVAATPAFAQVIRLGSITDTRFGTTWTLDGSQMTNTRAKLLNPANFGPAGTVTNSISITDTGGTVGSVTPALLANFDAFFIGYLTDSSANAFTAAELTALADFASGGGTLILTCDDTGHDAVCESFGFPITGGSTAPYDATAAGIASPIFSGPFGDVTSVNVSGNFGYYASTAGTTVLAVDNSGVLRPVILIQTLGAGQVVYLSDVDLVANAASAGALITTANDMFLGNLFAIAGAGGTAGGIPALDPFVLALLAMALAICGTLLVRRG